MKTWFNHFAFAVLAGVAALLTGCSVGQKSSPSQFFVLSALPPDTEPLPSASQNPPNVGVAQVRIPSFIDRPQITYRIGENEIYFSEFRRWGEPPSDGVTRVVRQNLTELLGAGRVAAFPWMQPYPRTVTLNVVVTDFGARTDGVAELGVIYRIADEKNQNTLLVREARYVDSSGQNLNDARAVAALSDTLAQFTHTAAEELIRINREVAATKALDEPVEQQGLGSNQLGH